MFNIFNYLKMLNLFFILLLIILLNFNCLYFELNKNQQKCFFAFEDVEKFGIVKYFLNNNNNKILPKQIQIKIYEINDFDNKNVIFRHIINSNKKGKFLFKIENKNGYKICVHNLYFNDIIKIQIFFEDFNNDKIFDFEFNEFPKLEELNIIKNKIENGIKISKDLLIFKENENIQEKNNFDYQKNYIFYWKILTYLQILILIFISIYQLKNFNKFLKSK